MAIKDWKKVKIFISNREKAYDPNWNRFRATWKTKYDSLNSSKTGKEITVSYFIYENTPNLKYVVLYYDGSNYEDTKFRYKKFKTKSQALAYAKSYMETH